MPIALSPGVNVSEIDLTTVVPGVATTEAGIGGVFRWGPVDKLVLVDSEDALAQVFGKPSSLNGETWFTAASFLAYSNALYVSRAFTEGNANTSLNSYNAYVNSASAGADLIIKNEDHYPGVTVNANIEWVAKYPGDIGNSLKISVCDSAAAYETAVPADNTVVDNSDDPVTTITVAFTVGSNTATVTATHANTVTGTEALTNLFANFAAGDVIKVGNSSIGYNYLPVSGFGTPTGSATETTATISFTKKLALSENFSITDGSLTRLWQYWDQVDEAPGQSVYQAQFGNTSANDEVHVVVIDEDGLFTNAPGTVLEVFQGLSRATDAKTADNAANYYKTVINDNSQYVWFGNDRTGAASNTAQLLTSASTLRALTGSFANGQDTLDEAAVSIGDVMKSYDKFRSEKDVDISFVLCGKSRGGTNGEQLPNYIIDNIATVRRDCMAFVSPERADVVSNVSFDIDADVVTFRNSLTSTSFAVMDSGYKYAYDKYNDVYRWVPLNGDIAGVCARTAADLDAWWSPAGVSRGQIKNVVRLAWSPSQAQRDNLYKNGVNPVVSFAGQGVILYGDKTLLSKPSAFDRINVRRLFIVLEKAIAIASQSTLFEFNDEFTRAAFVNFVTPFLRDVQGRRGIIDFRVICDETNNTGQVIDRNEFVGDIYIKPNRAINFIQLNFVAVRTGVEFSEIVGSV